MEFWILGGDERNRWAADYLQGIGYEVHTFGVPDCGVEPLPFYMEQVVLPFPSFQGALLRGVSAIPIEEVLHRIDSDSTVFGGLIGSWAQAFDHRKARVFDLYSSEPLTTAHAVPTAEGARCLAKEHSPLTLRGQRTGVGRRTGREDPGGQAEGSVGWCDRCVAKSSGSGSG